MCRDCLIEVRPDRARFVADTGAYVINYKGCAKCAGTKHAIVSKARTVEDNTETEEEDGEFEEITNYEHTCSSCSHVIAEHYHSFRIVRASLEEDECSITVAAAAPAAASSSSSSLSLQDEAAAPAPVAAAVRVTHDYLMECVLCGKGTDEQRFDAGGAPVAAKEVGASSSSSAAAPAAGAAPSFSLSSIQLNAMIRGSCAPGSSPMPAGAAAEAASAASAQATVVDDEWA